MLVIPYVLMLAMNQVIEWVGRIAYARAYRKLTTIINNEEIILKHI